MLTNREARRIELAVHLLEGLHAYQARTTSPEVPEWVIDGVRLALTVLVPYAPRDALKQVADNYRPVAGENATAKITRVNLLQAALFPIRNTALEKVMAHRQAKAVREGTKEHNDRREWQRRYHG